MYFIYRILTNLLIVISPIIFFFRILKGKEDKQRFLEKFGQYSANNHKHNDVWIHATSLGELMSVIPIIKKFEKNKKIKRVMLTTSTQSSAKIFSKLIFKKTFHIYFPLDTNYLTKKFLDYWQPQLAIFVDSEIWPNMFNNLNKKKIPIILLNARITKRTFERWQILSGFARKIFGSISLALPQNTETFMYLKKLGVKNIKLEGNLKFYGTKNLYKKETNILKKKFKNFKLWTVASTHHDEEIFIGNLHKDLKKNVKNLITVIIPRHINRSKQIIGDLNTLGLKTVTHSSKNKLKEDTDIYLVDSYGEASKFYNLTNITFVGGSLIKHGGQNPLEPARLGNFILNGPNIENFKEIYSHLIKQKISTTTSNSNKMMKIILKKINKKASNRITKKIFDTGIKILNKNFFHIKKYLS